MTTDAKQAKKDKVIEVLNKARAMELFVISQYMHQHFNLDDMDYGTLAMNMKLIAIDEMRHAENFAERIKQLGGDPVSAHDSKVIRGQEVAAIFNSDSEVEDRAIELYNQFAQICRENNDNTSMKLFETIIEEEQIHLTYFENTAKHITNLGDTYLSKIAGSASTTGGTTKSFSLNFPAAGNTTP